MLTMQPYRSIVGPKLEDDLGFLANGRQPQFFGKWKMTSVLWQMEDDLSFLANGRHPYFSLQVEDDLNFLTMEYTLIFWKNERQPRFKCKWKMTSISK